MNLFSEGSGQRQKHTSPDLHKETWQPRATLPLQILASTRHSRAWVTLFTDTLGSHLPPPPPAHASQVPQYLYVLDKLIPEFPRALRISTRLDENVECSVNLHDPESVKRLVGYVYLNCSTCIEPWPIPSAGRNSYERPNCFDDTSRPSSYCIMAIATHFHHHVVHEGLKRRENPIACGGYRCLGRGPRKGKGCINPPVFRHG